MYTNIIVALFRLLFAVATYSNAFGRSYSILLYNKIEYDRPKSIAVCSYLIF